MRNLYTAKTRIACAVLVALVGVMLAMQARGAAAAAHTRPATVAYVVIKNYTFHPSPLTIAHGTKVVWINKDSFPHTVTADDGSFDSGDINPGKYYVHLFSSAGTVTYHCKIHPWMHGTVTAT